MSQIIKRPKKTDNCANPSLGSGSGPDMSSLSDSERMAYSNVIGKSMVVTDRETAKDQSVSKIKYDSDIQDLKEKIAKKDEKIQELNNDRSKLRNERDGFKSRLESAKADLELEKGKVTSLNTQINALNETVSKQEKIIKKYQKEPAINQSDIGSDKKRIGELEEDNRKLNSKINELNAQLETLKADVSGKDTTIADLRATISGHDLEVARLEDMLRIKTEENESIRQRPDISGETSPVPDSGTLKRTSPTELYSDLFTDGRYDVKIARSGSTILFVPNVEGSALCIDHMIKLPRLSELLPFKAPCEYMLEPAGNNVLKAELK